MKKAILIFLLAINITPAYADEMGGWVKVDAKGTIISGTMVCTPVVCGDSNSLFSQLTLLAGKRYVQITKADPVTGNVAGPNVIDHGPNTKITGVVNLDTGVATINTVSVLPMNNHTIIMQKEDVYSVAETQPLNDIVDASVIVQPKIAVEKTMTAEEIIATWEIDFDKWFTEWVIYMQEFWA